jgi:hypothetical protein
VAIVHYFISGVPPFVHGILGNLRPRTEGGDYYWSAYLLKARTLLDVAKAAGKSTAAINMARNGGCASHLQLA